MVPTTAVLILVGSTTESLKENTTMVEQSMTVADVVARAADGSLDDFRKNAVAFFVRELMEGEITPRVGSKRRSVACCPEIHDLALSKLAAGRRRDIDYASQAVGHGLIDLAVVGQRVADLPVDEEAQARIASLIKGLESPDPPRPALPEHSDTRQRVVSRHSNTYKLKENTIRAAGTQQPPGPEQF